MLEILFELTWMDYVGVVGTIIIVAAYYASQMRYMSSEDLLFPLLNLVGSILIAFSLYFDFNFPSVLMEFFWILISLIGIIRWFTAKYSKT
ncbi:MAG: hypothetical protein HRU28_07910 [Rhizobiales bacterium]|nr:hypothetical protein [Hyphomicrobiales bacterium]